LLANLANFLFWGGTSFSLTAPLDSEGCDGVGGMRTLLLFDLSYFKLL
jgi:hypothetical protein